LLFNEVLKDNLEKCQIAQLKNLRAKTYIQKPIAKNTLIPDNATIIEHKDGTKSYQILKNPEEYFDEFKSKMIARRVLIFLYFKYGVNMNTINSMLDKGTVFENEIESFETHIKSIEKKITDSIKLYSFKSGIRKFRVNNLKIICH